MNTQTFPLELITPCFGGGARPEAQAEIRAPSIRGQLRWWFRAVGGFKSLVPLRVAEQERLVFGSAASGLKVASPLVIRVKAEDLNTLRSHVAKDADALQAPPGTDRGYLLFPLRQQHRALFEATPGPKFDLDILWNGDDRLWEDIHALIALFGHLGSLGFRSRRAMGALAFRSNPPVLGVALQRFAAPHQIAIKQLPARDANHAIALLARWLKGWRSYGRTADLRRNPQRGPGFKWAKNDHDAGRNRTITQTYRPAVGLPMVQHFSDGGPSIHWSFGLEHPDGDTGRFASPILLRPYRAAPTRWLGLILFVDSRQWPAGKKVFLNGQPRSVSLDLYQAMKNDPALRPFP